VTRAQRKVTPVARVHQIMEVLAAGRGGALERRPSRVPPAGNGGQCATAMLAAMAITATWSL